MILANAGVIKNSELLNLLEAYRNETSASIWEIASMAIKELRKFVDDDELAEAKLRNFVKSLATEQFNRLGCVPLLNEPENDTKLRNIIVGLMIYSEDDNLIKYATNQFKSTKLENLNPDLRPLIISAVIKHAKNEKSAIRLLDDYKSDIPGDLKSDICFGVTSTKNEKVIKKLLDSIKDTSIIKTQDVVAWTIYLIKNKYAKDKTWQWIKDNWGWIDSIFGDGKNHDDFPRFIASALSKRGQLDEYCKFFIPLRQDPTLTRVIDMGISEIKNRVELIERDKTLVKTALNNLAQPSAGRPN
jgi:aminopeptidase N